MNKRSVLTFLTIYLFSFILAKADPIKVMIIDGGVEITHPLLTRVKPVNPFEKSPLKPSFTSNHGTHVAGLVIYGPMNKDFDKSDELCEDVRIISCQVFPSATDDIFIKNELFCLNYAFNHGIKYINMSLGGYNYLRKEYDVFLKLSESGVKIIAAAGNDNKNIDEFHFYPAYFHKTLKNVIAISNIKSDGNLTPTSNYGDGVLKENGDKVLSTLPYASGGFGEKSGTSMAAAVYTHNLLKKECISIHKQPKRTVSKPWAM
jgi:subtilisin family serine protease